MATKPKAKPKKNSTKPDKDKGIEQFNFRGPRELHTEVHAAAAGEGINFASYCRRALWDSLNQPRRELSERLDTLEEQVAALEAVRGIDAYGS